MGVGMLLQFGDAWWATTGRASASEYHDAVLDRSRQVADMSKAKPQGTGLGLAICRMIVEHFDGRIWVASEPGQGARFFVRLPRRMPLAKAV